MKYPPAAQFEISIDGRPRAHSVTRRLSRSGGAEMLKSRLRTARRVKRFKTGQTVLVLSILCGAATPLTMR
jgi:hypothetical protein